MTTTPPIVEAIDLTKSFKPHGRLNRGVGPVRAVNGVDLAVQPGETLGIVGESGCGKSTLCRLMIGLVKPTTGDVRLRGVSLASLSAAKLRDARRSMQIIFQDPYSSLDPRMTVRQIIGEGPAYFKTESRRDRERSIRQMLDVVGLRARDADRYPHEFSGGQRQRIGIARALILRPDFVVADEPISALDVSIQSQILNLLIDLKRERAVTYVFVSHNIGAIEYISDRVAVMHLGKVVEIAEQKELRDRPLHPYTKALWSSIPKIGDASGIERPPVLQGELPSPSNPPSGCTFRTRCPIAQDICAVVEPPLVEHGSGHTVACHFADDRVTV